jgi:hypothetical protein
MYRRCGLAYPYDWRGFVGSKKKTSVGLSVSNFSMAFHVLFCTVLYLYNILELLVELHEPLLVPRLVGQVELFIQVIILISSIVIIKYTLEHQINNK